MVPTSNQGIAYCYYGVPSPYITKEYCYYDFPYPDIVKTLAPFPEPNKLENGNMFQLVPIVLGMGYVKMLMVM